MKPNIALASLMLLACTADTTMLALPTPPDCGADATPVLAEPDEWYCVHDAAGPEVTCPPDVPFQYFVRTELTGHGYDIDWESICVGTDHGDSYELPTEICSELDVFNGCEGIRAEDDGECCFVQGCAGGGNSGWAPRPTECRSGLGFDGQFDSGTDAWGCTYIVPAGAFCPGFEGMLGCCVD